MYSLEIYSHRAALISLSYVTASPLCLCACWCFCLHLWYCAWRNWNSSLILSQESEVVNFSCCDEACQREKHVRTNKIQAKREKNRKGGQGEKIIKNICHRPMGATSLKIGWQVCFHIQGAVKPQNWKWTKAETRSPDCLCMHCSVIYINHCEIMCLHTSLTHTQPQIGVNRCRHTPIYPSIDITHSCPLLSRTDSIFTALKWPEESLLIAIAHLHMVWTEQPTD